MNLDHQKSKARSVAPMKKWSGRRGDKTPVNQTNDDAASSSSFSSEDFSVSTDSFMTPSMEFPDRTSFRNLGGEDGDMERIYPVGGGGGKGVRPPGLKPPPAKRPPIDYQGSWWDFVTYSAPEENKRCLELDLHKFRVPDRTSFRVFGDMDRIYKSIGVSGPQDLAISFDAWEASKKRSSSDFDKFQVCNVSEAGPSGEADNNTESSKCGLVRAPTITVKSRGYFVPNPTDVVVVVGGINGVRPPSSSSSSDNGREEALEEEVERVLENETMFSSDSSRKISDTSPIYSNGGSIITSWQKGKLLGRGSFGSVYEGISADGEFFAVKEVSLLEKGIHAQECIQELEWEIALLSQLQHPNIVRYRGTDKDESNLYIFLELVSQGSLLKLYQRYQLMDSVVSLYTRQILDGLKYLHGKGFTHQDIKCANILVDASGAVKLADFGLAEVSVSDDIKSCKGTAFWMAPEVISPKLSDGYGSSADIWSLGCTVLEMLTRRVPYCDRENPVCALFKIATGVLPNIPDTLSLEARDLIVKCLKVNLEERPTAAELLNHPFVRRSPLSSSGYGLSTVLSSPLINKAKACKVQRV